MECPICMDDIEACNINCVTTECGHQFHTSCLMRNIAHNGFGCPYCRSIMAEEVEDSDDDDEYNEQDDDEETIVSDVTYDPQSTDNERALSGMRRLFRRAENDIENAADGIDSDDDEDYYDDEEVIKLTSQQITDTLVRANFTMTDIVKAYTIVTGCYQNGEDETDEQVDEFMEKLEDHMNKLQRGDIPPVLPIVISVKEEKFDIAESKISKTNRLTEVDECL